MRRRERELEPVKLLTEKEVYQNQIDRTLKPFKNGATKVVKRIGKVIKDVRDEDTAIGKSVAGFLSYLRKEGQKPHRPHKESPIDLGFGGNIKPAEYRRRLAKVLKGSGRKAKVRRAKINLAKKRVQQSRNY